MLTLEQMQVTRGKGETSFTVQLPHLQLLDGQVMAVRGVSGCGKSTLLEMIGLILKPDSLIQMHIGKADQVCDISADVRLQNQSRLAYYRATHFGFMLQTGGLLPFLNVQQNIALPSQIIQQALDLAWIEQMVEHLQVSHLLKKYPKQLSIGERQRVAFIRAVSHKPTILLADEPTAALDPDNANQLFDLIVDLIQSFSLSALIVTHDWEMIKDKRLPSIQAQLSNRVARFVRVEDDAQEEGYDGTY